MYVRIMQTKYSKYSQKMIFVTTKREERLYLCVVEMCIIFI